MFCARASPNRAAVGSACTESARHAAVTGGGPYSPGGASYVFVAGVAVFLTKSNERVMNRRDAFVFILCGAMAIGLVGCAANEDEQAIAHIQQLGGHVKTDAQGHVVEVDLHDTRTRDKDLSLFLALPYVHRVNLSGTPITGSGLGQLARLHDLQILYLVGSEVNNAGLAQIAALGSLETLHLGGTKISDTGLPALRGLKNLRSLSLGDTEITNAGLVNFRDLRNLSTLIVHHTKVTADGVQELRRFLPKARIEG